ncbi:Phage integrase family protein [Caballeronia hypogeia]|uniref:Phage integrase family protein n=1 Tax=Caballeronia hypogeia TaxID=1777140 RepID=A0A158AV71_9BURK|nr:site-specific integrase [Caballeronia hypogeia]SAK61346.1 Phage integrase family protein [Caballeronia hypogeia]
MMDKLQSYLTNHGHGQAGGHMLNPPIKCAVLPAFILTETCDAADPLGRKRVIPAGAQRAEQTYHIREVAKAVDSYGGYPKWVKFNYNLLPLVLDSRGVLWDAPTIYILARCQAHLNPDMTTFQSIAEDLSIFMRFLEEFEVDYLAFPRFKLQRPTYRFHGYLKNRILQRKTAPATAKRAMGSVIGFYRFLVAEGMLVPENPLWEDRDQYLTFKDARGLSISKRVNVTDVSIRAPKQLDPYDGCISDGERLRPLPQNEQEWLFEALAGLQNPEMLLVHLLMVTSGARIQTALTLRVADVRNELTDSAREFRCSAGPGTGIDTKNNKQLTIHIPRWVYEMLRKYAFSDRAAARRSRAKGGNNDDQYLFLTQQGSPYYQQKAESLRFDPDFDRRYRERGQALRMFIRDRVIPWVRQRYARDFHYKPHDLRATYGMNLTDVQLAAVERKEKTLSQARDFVRVRMGHECSATTDLYLNFRSNQATVYAAVDGHEAYFRDLIEKAWRGALNAEA